MTNLFAEYGPKAIAELQRRGWAQGALAKETDDNPEFDWDKWPDRNANLGIPMHITVPVEDCRVCALGALGAAYYGDPRKGEDKDGAGYDDMVRHLANTILPGWEEETYAPEEWDLHTDTDTRTPIRRWNGPASVVVGYNDEEATSVEDVIEKLTAAIEAAAA